MFAARVSRQAYGGRNPILRGARQTLRYQSTKAAEPGTSPFIAGVAGGLAGAGLLYGIYQMTPTGKMARKINIAARETDKKYQQVAATIKDKTPTTDEAVNKLKQFCYSWVAWVPGGRQYVDTAFSDLDAIRKSRGDEVDKIVSETYRDLQGIARADFSLESVPKVYDALANLAKKIASLSGRAADHILERHPQLDEKVGEPIRQLKQMGAQYGPDANKLADETWRQVNDVMASGFSIESADKVRKVVEERTQQMHKVGDEFWEKSLKQAKPYLDKSARLKELVTGNIDVLKQGDVADLFKRIKSLGESGDMAKLEDYVKQVVDKAKGAGKKATGGNVESLRQFLGEASGDAGRKVEKNIMILSEAVNKESEEGRQLLEETKEDLQKLLAEKAEKAGKIVDSMRHEMKH